MTLEIVLHRRKLAQDQFVHHSNGRSQYLPVQDIDGLDENKITPSVSSIGFSNHDTLTDTIKGLFKVEAIYRRGP